MSDFFAQIKNILYTLDIFYGNIKTKFFATRPYSAIHAARYTKLVPHRWLTALV